MNNTKTDIASDKYLLILNILEDKKNCTLFNKLDYILLQKRFKYIQDYSINENIIHANTDNLTSQTIVLIINNFIDAAYNNQLLDTRFINEMLKISNLPEKKLLKSLSNQLLEDLYFSFKSVSRETLFISQDFMFLKIIDNFIYKNILDNDLMNKFIELKKAIYKKILNYKYKKEKKDKETTFLCWIDQLTTDVIENYLLPQNFVIICNNIFKYTDQTVYTYRKTLNNLIFLLRQRDFSQNEYLRKFKIKLEKTIQNIYTYFDINKDEMQNLMLKTLAKKYPDKEDFYYIMDSLRFLAEKSSEDKSFCLDLCNYLIYHDKKYNIFGHRFVRKYFFDTLKLLINSDDTYALKEKELKLFIKILHINLFFCFNREEILSVIISILGSMNSSNIKITKNNFYKYCDILDFIMYKNPDLQKQDAIDIICQANDNKNKVLKRFNLVNF